MNKGVKTKNKIKEETKRLILEKGYSFVTMTEVSKKAQLSIGGLYHHYSSIEEITLDIINSETNKVWDIFDNDNSFQECVSRIKEYFDLEKADLLNFKNSVNAIIYQYYFSFSYDVRAEKLRDGYKSTIYKIQGILKAYLEEKSLYEVVNHIFVVIHGLNFLAMTGEITEKIIDSEFNNLIEKIKRSNKYEG